MVTPHIVIPPEQPGSTANLRPQVADRYRPLLVLSALHAALALGILVYRLETREGYLMDAVSPFGGDFINLWTVAKLILRNAVDTIYDPAAFMPFQQGIVGADIGHRLWAYPPTSLFLAWPFGFIDYYPALAVWSALSLAFLAGSARIFGFGWRATVVLCLSPAALTCLFYGQTGNIFAGLMLIALAPTVGRSRALAAALLTIKAQTGFLLAPLWLVEKRWGDIVGAVAVTLLIVGASIAAFGLQPWKDYLGLTVPELSQLEKHGHGPFTLMIPSLFMSLRLLGVQGDTALVLHGVFAAGIFVGLLRKLMGAQHWETRAALVLMATALVTPYMHNYDLAIILAAALLWHIRCGSQGWRGFLASRAVLLAWAAPYLVTAFGVLHAPIMPLVLLCLFLIIRDEPQAVEAGNRF